MLIKQGQSLEELVETRTGVERGVQCDSGGDRTPPTEGAAGKPAVCDEIRLSSL